MVADPAPRLRIGIDTGGTFTDVVAFDEASGTLTVTKTPSTPADPAAGFMAGLAKVLALAGAVLTPSPRSPTARRSRRTSCSRVTSGDSDSSPPWALSSCWR